jgi:hypothetical protein
MLNQKWHKYIPMQSSSIESVRGQDRGGDQLPGPALGEDRAIQHHLAKSCPAEVRHDEIRLWSSTLHR